MTTTLKDAKIGDKVQVFLDQLGDVSREPTDTVITATVVATGQPTYVRLGWKESDKRPIDVEHHPKIELSPAYPHVLSNWEVEGPYNQYYRNDTKCVILSSSSVANENVVPLGKATIGDKVRFFLDAGSTPCRKATNRYIEGTVIACEFKDEPYKFVRVAWDGEVCNNMACVPSAFSGELYKKCLSGYERFEHSVILDEKYDCVILPAEKPAKEEPKKEEPAKNIKALKDIPVGSKVCVGEGADAGIVLGSVTDRVLVGWPSSVTWRPSALPIGVFDMAATSVASLYGCDVAWPYTTDTTCEVIEEAPSPPSTTRRTNLNATKPGDRVRVPIDSFGNQVVYGSGSRSIEATVLAVSSGGSYRLLGWKTNEQTPCGTEHASSSHIQALYPGDWSLYSHVKDVPGYYECDVPDVPDNEHQEAPAEEAVEAAEAEAEVKAPSEEEHQSTSLMPLFIGAVMGRMLSNAVAAEPTEIVRVTAPPVEEEAPAPVPAAAEKALDA